LLTWPWLYQTIRWAGVAFLFWLAWDAWKSPGAGETASEDTPGRDLGQAFVRGLAGNLLNPKAAVFYVALLPTFIRPDHARPLVQALTLGTLHLGVALVVHGLIVLGAAAAGARLLTDAKGPWLRAASALGIVAVAIWMAWETRG
ncbi:LysE family translocator, partial [Brevundimonas sp.]|uniref:LysE family translocator n=1 Tax=Brevundimonas sp. TaxID=1871086 RepID=UPI001A2DDB93